MTVGRIPSIEGGIQPTIVDAKGDLITAVAADTPARIGVGSNGQLLSANSSTATGLEWVAAPSSGGMTLLSTTTLSGTSITFSSIPSGYIDLRLVIKNFLPSNTYNYTILRINGDTNNRYTAGYEAPSGVLDHVDTFSSPGLIVSSSQNNTAPSRGISIVDIFDYTNTTIWKFLHTRSIGNDGGTASSGDYSGIFGAYNQPDAITSITLFVNSGTFTSGTALLYGVK